MSNHDEILMDCLNETAKDENIADIMAELVLGCHNQVLNKKDISVFKNSGDVENEEPFMSFFKPAT